MNLATLRAAVERGDAFDYVLFYGHAYHEPIGTECFSQWYPALFTVDGRTYGTAEHYMMAEKARLFGDDEMRAAILAAPTPAAAKALGRQVRGFTDEAWTAHRSAFVVAGNVAKFDQNPDLARVLLATGDAVLVEAAPRDRIWGIGMGASNPDARDPRKWRGQNLLGFALMEARSRLRRR